MTIIMVQSSEVFSVRAAVSYTHLGQAQIPGQVLYSLVSKGFHHLVHIHIQYFIKQHQAALILDRSCYIIRRIVYGLSLIHL